MYLPKIFSYLVFIIIILMSIFFFLFTNPMLLSVSLLIISLLLFVPLGQLVNSWFSMSIILIFSGGMMIIFLYLTSLSSNQKFLPPHKNFFPLFFLLLYPMPLNHPQNFFLSLNFLFSEFNQKIMYFIIFYIILTLMLVVKMSQHFLGNMKKTY